MRLAPVVTALMVLIAFRVDGVPCRHEILRGLTAMVLSTDPKLSRTQMQNWFRVRRVVGALLSNKELAVETTLGQMRELSPQAVAEIVRVLADVEPTLRVALLQRARWLGRSGTPQARAKLFEAMANANKSYDGGPQPKVHSVAELQPWVRSARANAAADPEHVIKHLIGEQLEMGAMGSQPQSKTGRHLFDSWDRFLFERADALLGSYQPQFLALAEEQDNADSPTARQLRDLYGEVGFDVSRTGWSRFLLREMQLLSFRKHDNGALCLTFPKEVFTPYAWNATYQASRYGSSPPGGKSVFPVSWGIVDKIQPAILAVMDDPNSRILRRGTKNGLPSFYLKSQVDGVWIEVGITGDRANTAFPSWRQYEPATIGQAYLDWWSSWERVREVGYRINQAAIIPTDFRSVDQLVSAFYGVKPAAISDAEWASMRNWLDPAQLSQSPRPILSKAFHHILFEFVERERVLRELEDTSGAFFP